MRLSTAIQGDLGQFLEGELTELAGQVRAAVNAAAEGLRDELRAQVRSASLGLGLEKAWRSETYPKGRRTLRPAGLVYSKSTVLHRAYIEGPTIVAGKRFLVIATPAAIRMGFGETNVARRGGGIPAGAKRKYSSLGAAMSRLGKDRLRLVPAKRGRFVVLYEPAGRARPVVLFVLVRSVKVRRLLDFDGPAEKWLNELYSRLAALG